MDRKRPWEKKDGKKERKKEYGQERGRRKNDGRNYLRRRAERRVTGGSATGTGAAAAFRREERAGFFCGASTSGCGCSSSCSCSSCTGACVFLRVERAAAAAPRLPLALGLLTSTSIFSSSASVGGSSTTAVVRRRVRRVGKGEGIASTAGARAVRRVRVRGALRAGDASSSTTGASSSG